MSARWGMTGLGKHFLDLATQRNTTLRNRKVGVGEKFFRYSETKHWPWSSCWWGRRSTRPAIKEAISTPGGRPPRAQYHLPVGRLSAWALHQASPRGRRHLPPRAAWKSLCPLETPVGPRLEVHSSIKEQTSVEGRNGYNHGGLILPARELTTE